VCVCFVFACFLANSRRGEELLMNVNVKATQNPIVHQS
jgi:hypothetical protein